MKSWLVGRLGLGLGMFGLAVACGASDSGSGVNGAAASGGTGATGTGGSGNTGTGGFGNTGTGGGINTDGGGASGGSGGIEECAGETQTGELVPLDMYVMMDISGSMTGDTQGGGTKWDAVKDAMKAFFNDSGSAGIGVGLQYFPLRKPGVPATCTSNAQCGDGAPCFTHVCWNLLPGQTVYCQNNRDCGVIGGNCVQFGECANDSNYTCPTIGGQCGNAPNGQDLGACVAPSGSFCINATSCLVGDYATPAVAIDLLPGNAGALINSLDAQSPTGNTPTGPALQGAIDHATSYANANPDHRVITVMATDGLPTECAPTDIGQLANVATGGVNGTPSISTFVIGVFSQSEAQQASSNLNQIAQAGSGRNAFMVDTGGNVTQQFIDALNDIRGSALACEYLLPDPPAGETLDYRKVNVLHNGNTVFYVGDRAGCDANQGGWYYDVDPSQGGTPTKIIMCPATCDLFQSTTGGSVDIKLGCVTEDIPR